MYPLKECVDCGEEIPQHIQKPRCFACAVRNSKEYIPNRPIPPKERVKLPDPPKQSWNSWFKGGYRYIRRNVRTKLGIDD